MASERVTGQLVGEEKHAGRVRSHSASHATQQVLAWPDVLQRLQLQLPARRWRTRFAPAPTGYLHMGHLVNAIYVWGVARAFGGDVVLRIEDHDGTRCRAEFERALLDDLDWLALEPDDAPTGSFRDSPSAHPGRQSARGPVYEAALNGLDDTGVVYPCQCTRRDIERVAPHAPGTEPRYPGTCAALGISPSATLARRARMHPGLETFDDLRLGLLAQDPSQQCGDVLVRDRAGYWTYQFSAAVDDLRMNIDLVIRGEDLLESTARQIRMAHLLGRADPPRYLHHPLLVHPDGAKLSKANHDTAIRERRARGATPEELLGEAAWLVGLMDAPGSIHARDLGSLFSERRADRALPATPTAVP